MNQSPHFYKAYSRIGLTQKPIRQSEWNHGVEEASDQILTPEFLNGLGKFSISKYRFSKPEKMDQTQYYSILASQLKEFAQLINHTLKQHQQIQFVIGGDNSVTFSSLLALINRVPTPQKIGYIQFDSHGESSTAKNSSSGNFHGMYLRPFFDHFDIAQIEDLVPQKLQPSQALFIGDLILDGDEPEFFSRNNFRNITLAEYLKNRAKVQRQIKDFISNFDYIHINFDIDIFLENVAGATGIPTDGRWGIEEVFELLNIIFSHPNISLDLSEINPQRPGAAQTIKLAQNIILNFLNSRVSREEISLNLTSLNL